MAEVGLFSYWISYFWVGEFQSYWSLVILCSADEIQSKSWKKNTDVRKVDRPTNIVLNLFLSHVHTTICYANASSVCIWHQYLHLKLPFKLTTLTVICSLHENNKQLFIQLQVPSIPIPNVPGTVKFSCVTLFFWWLHGFMISS